MNSVNDNPTPTDRAFPETVLGRTALCAIAWYPERSASEAEWSFQQDLAWCLAPLPSVAKGDELRRLVVATIIDPTRHRSDLVLALQAIAADDRVSPGVAESDLPGR